MIDPVVSVSLRCLLALLFAAAAWHKVSDPPRFESTLEAYRLLPSRLAKVVTKVLPVAEIAVSLSLLLPVYHWAALGAVALLVLYSVAITVNLARGRREIDCGCFGPAARVPLSGVLIVRNTMLIAAAALVLLPVRARPLVWIDAFTLVAAVAAASFVWIAFWRLNGAAGIQRGVQ